MIPTRNFKQLIGLFLLFILLSACGLIGQDSGSNENSEEAVSEANLDATATRIAADIFATQTAAVPEATATNTPEPTATPTDTPEPSPTPTDTPEPTATPTDTPEPTDTPLPTATPLPDVIVIAPSVNLRNGPGLAYGSIGAVEENETATVDGQAYDCGWLLVTVADGQSGWITGGAEFVTLNLDCADIPAAEIPPTPIPPATNTPPATATPDNRPTVTLYIDNKTGGTLTINLSGPAEYSFTFEPGFHNVQVIPGTYSYTVFGCGGATTTGTTTIEDGNVWEWSCTSG